MSSGSDGLVARPVSPGDATKLAAFNSVDWQAPYDGQAPGHRIDVEFPSVGDSAKMRDMHPLHALARILPLDQPMASLVWQAAVLIGDRQALGASPLGERFIVPILGGTVWGAGIHAALKGSVLPGRADRQLLRADGIKELDALYEMRLDDGTVLTVRNRVIVDDKVQPRYGRSVVHVTAPAGPWAWLNAAVWSAACNRCGRSRRRCW